MFWNRYWLTALFTAGKVFGVRGVKLLVRTLAGCCCFGGSQRTQCSPRASAVSFGSKSHFPTLLRKFLRIPICIQFRPSSTWDLKRSKSHRQSPSRRTVSTLRCQYR
ncbi:uncharacterized protein IWZ02DRAFT_18477 [Phyllosticta citriasiana]|uniref:uncharacterized protein n=1 Tax=Phyllosticta citriasiana TaxID=595635 RepID=UPI0030FDE8B4